MKAVVLLLVALLSLASALKISTVCSGSCPASTSQQTYGNAPQTGVCINAYTAAAQGLFFNCPVNTVTVGTVSTSTTGTLPPIYVKYTINSNNTVTYASYGSDSACAASAASVTYNCSQCYGSTIYDCAAPSTSSAASVVASVSFVAAALYALL